MTNKQKAKDMRHAIDMIEGALFGLGDGCHGGQFVDIADLWVDARDDLELRPPMTLGQIRRVRAALSECTRIINSDEYLIDRPQ